MQTKMKDLLSHKNSQSGIKDKKNEKWRQLQCCQNYPNKLDSALLKRGLSRGMLNFQLNTNNKPILIQNIHLGATTENKQVGAEPQYRLDKW